MKKIKQNRSKMNSDKRRIIYYTQVGFTKKGKAG